MINLETARKVIAAAEQKAEEIRQPMNIAVVDAGGNLLVHVRMDGAWIGSKIFPSTRLSRRAPSISRPKISLTTPSLGGSSSAFMLRIMDGS